MVLEFVDRNSEGLFFLVYTGRNSPWGFVKIAIIFREVCYKLLRELPAQRRRLQDIEEFDTEKIACWR